MIMRQTNGKKGDERVFRSTAIPAPDHYKIDPLEFIKNNRENNKDKELSVIKNTCEILLANNFSSDIYFILSNVLGQALNSQYIKAGELINISTFSNNSPLFIVYQNSNKEFVSIKL